MASTEGRPGRARYHGRRLAVLGLALPLILGGYAAFAAVNGAPVSSTNGNAGYGAATADPGGFTDVQSVVTGGQYGLAVKAGAQGVQMCVRAPGPAPSPSATTPSATPSATATVTATPSPSLRPAPANLAAQVGLLSDNLKTTYHVASVLGVLPSPGCPVGGVAPSPVDFPALTAVPFGHRVWVDASLNRTTRSFRVLVCVLRFRPGGPPVPLAPDQPVPGVTPAPGLFPGFRCFFRTVTRHAATVTFMAQDLDASTTAPAAGDLPGVQVREVRVPSGTVFTDAGAGVNEDLTSLVPCAGNGFPKTLAGPAAEVSAACQPVSAFDHATATVAGGAAQPFSALTTTEGVSPGSTAATPALVAPDNTLAGTPASTPPGTAANASAGGNSFTLFTGNVPTS